MAVELPKTLPVIEAGPRGSRVALVLHGGGGPRTVTTIVAHLASTMRVFAPTHPGWDGTDRSDSVESVADLATGYLIWLLERGHRDVVVIGSSLGGWTALEMAVQGARDAQYAGLVGAVVDIDGVGALVDGEPMADFFALDARGLAEAAWHDPERGYLDPASLTDEQRAAQQANGRAMGAITGPGMSDPTLLGRLPGIDVPTLVVWGGSDRIATPAYGRTVATAIPGARFAVVDEAGHLPHLEAPDTTFATIDAFLSLSSSMPKAGRKPMWSIEYAQDTDLAPHAVWEAVEALETGAVRLRSGDGRSLDNEFAIGGTVTATPVGIGALNSTILELEPDRVLASSTTFNGLELLLRHTLEPTAGGGTRIIRELQITGPDVEEQGPIAGPRISADYDDALEEIIDVARTFADREQ